MCRLCRRRGHFLFRKFLCQRDDTSAEVDVGENANICSDGDGLQRDDVGNDGEDNDDDDEDYIDDDYDDEESDEIDDISMTIS